MFYAILQFNGKISVESDSWGDSLMGSLEPTSPLTAGYIQYALKGQVQQVSLNKVCSLHREVPLCSLRISNSHCPDFLGNTPPGEITLTQTSQGHRRITWCSFVSAIRARGVFSDIKLHTVWSTRRTSRWSIKTRTVQQILMIISLGRENARREAGKRKSSSSLWLTASSSAWQVSINRLYSEGYTRPQARGTKDLASSSTPEALSFDDTAAARHCLKAKKWTLKKLVEQLCHRSAPRIR